MTSQLIPGSAKGQTNMILVVLLIVVFLAVAVFLLSLAQNVSQEDYMDSYVNNLMLSLMRTDTGYSDQDCKLISDLTACAFVLPDKLCGDSGISCLDLAEQDIEEYIDAFELISENYRFLLTVESVGFMSTEDQRKMEIGDTSLADYKGKKRASSYAIQKSMAGSQWNLKAILYLARKES